MGTNGVRVETVINQPLGDVARLDPFLRLPAIAEDHLVQVGVR